MIGLFPIVLILAVLVIAGIVWIFHHHHWRPFAGIFLFVVGIGVFFVLMRESVHMEQRAPQMAPRFNDPWQRGDSGASDRTRETTGDGRSIVNDSARSDRRETPSDRAPGETSTAPNGATKTAEKIAEAPLASPQPTDIKDADAKPYWIEKPPHSERMSGQQVYVATAVSGRYSTPAECKRAIIPAINEVVGNYAAEYIADADGQPLSFDQAYIREELIKDEYWEPVTASVGQMHQLHVKLVFDSRVRDELDRRARMAKVEGRLKYAAAGTAVALLLLGGLYSILKRGTPAKSAVA